MSVHQRKDSGSWVAKYRDEFGKQITITFGKGEEARKPRHTTTTSKPKSYAMSNFKQALPKMSGSTPMNSQTFGTRTERPQGAELG